jgi:hypothetical protein
MAFVNKSDTKKIYAYLTKNGREKILTGQTSDFIITQFSLHDDDVNYEIAENKINSNYNILPSGFIPDVTGDNQDCTLSLADQLLKNELFGSVPVRIPVTGCGISTATNYNPNLNTQLGDVINNSLCIFPPPQPLVLTDVRGQCHTDPYRFKISVNNIDGGTPPYKWYVETNYFNNNMSPWNVLRNEGEEFIFETPTQGNATYTVKISDSSTPPITAEKIFTNISCIPPGPIFKISGKCSENPTEFADVVSLSGIYNGSGARNRPVWLYNLTIEYISPPKKWSYIIVSKALSPFTPNSNDFRNLDFGGWDANLTTRPTAPPYLGFGTSQERRQDFNNTTSPFRTDNILLPGNIGRTCDFQVIFYDETLSYANQATSRVTAFTINNVFCAPKKIRLQIYNTNKYIALNRYDPIEYIENYGYTNPFAIYDEQDLWYGTKPSELFPFNYITPSVAPTRIMNFHNYTLDYGFKKIQTQYSFELDAVELSIPIYIAWDDLGNDYADIYQFTKANIPTDLKIQFKTVGTYNKQNIKFPQIGNPKIDWTEGSDGITSYSPEYTLVDAELEQSWTYNGRTQRPVFTRYDKSTSQNPIDGEKIYTLYQPGYEDAPNNSTDTLNPGTRDSSGDYQLYDPPLKEFSYLEDRVNTLIAAGETLTDIGSSLFESMFNTRERTCIVYKYILPIRFNPKNPGVSPSAQKSILNLKIEMVCNHPSISTVNSGWGFTYPSNTYEIQLEVANNQIF